MTKGKKEALVLAQNHIDASFSVSRLNTFQEKCFSPPVQIWPQWRSWSQQKDCFCWLGSSFQLQFRLWAKVQHAPSAFTHLARPAAVCLWFIHTASLLRTLLPWYCHVSVASSLAFLGICCLPSGSYCSCFLSRNEYVPQYLIALKHIITRIQFCTTSW